MAYSAEERDKLAGFAIQVLTAMETCEDWNTELINEIKDFAFACGLAEDDDNSMFRMKHLPIAPPHDGTLRPTDLKSTPLVIDTTPQYLALHPSKNGTQWVVHWMVDKPVPRAWSGFYTPHLEKALAELQRKCALHDLEVDWDSWKIPTGQAYHVLNESSYGAQSETFGSKEDFDAYRKNQLEMHYAAFDDTDDVDTLLEAGLLDAAWEKATGDYPEDPENPDATRDKQFLTTAFGTFEITVEDVAIPFRRLPEWVQNAITGYAKAQYKKMLT